MEQKAYIGTNTDILSTVDCLELCTSQQLEFQVLPEPNGLKHGQTVGLIDMEKAMIIGKTGHIIRTIILYNRALLGKLFLIE